MRAFGKTLAVVVLCVTVAGCMAKRVPAEFAERSNRIGVICLLNDRFIHATQEMFGSIDIETGTLPGWQPNRFFTDLIKERMNGNGHNTYVSLDYDPARLWKIYDATALDNYGNDVLENFLTLGASENSSRFYKIDAVKQDLRAIAQAKDVDLLLLVTTNRFENIGGFGIILPYQRKSFFSSPPLPKVYATVGIRIFNAQTMERIAYARLDPAQGVPHTYWNDKLADLTPQQTADIKATLEHIVRLELTNYLQQLRLL